MRDFIEIYDNVLNSNTCETLIKHFEYSNRIYDSVTNAGFNPNAKKGKSWDILLNTPVNETERSICIDVLKGLTSRIPDYKKKYPETVYTSEWFVDPTFHIQKFSGSEEGYFARHCEHDAVTPNRILVWMFYLNDCCGTKFPSQRRTIKGRKGRLLIWPSFWTHTHHGVIPNKGDKYIISGWCSFT